MILHCCMFCLLCIMYNNWEACVYYILSYHYNISKVYLNVMNQLMSNTYCIAKL